MIRKAKKDCFNVSISYLNDAWDSCFNSRNILNERWPFKAQSGCIMYPTDALGLNRLQLDCIIKLLRVDGEKKLILTDLEIDFDPLLQEDTVSNHYQCKFLSYDKYVDIFPFGTEHVLYTCDGEVAVLVMQNQQAILAAEKDLIVEFNSYYKRLDRDLALLENDLNKEGCTLKEYLSLRGGHIMTKFS